MALILSLGSINADFQMRVDSAPAGPGMWLARDLLRTSGGKASNVAVLARRLGSDACLVGCVGDDDLAEQALTGPRRDGVDLSAVSRVAGPTGLAAITVAPDGDKTIVLALNANDNWTDDEINVDHSVSEAPGGSVLVADLEVPPTVVVSATRAARSVGFVVVLDPSPPERLPGGFLSDVDHITPDHREATTLTGIEATSPEGAYCAAETLRGQGVSAAYVKLPHGGCVLACDDGAYMVPAPHVDVVDATGAGDAFAGALAWGLLCGRSPLGAAMDAVAAAACAVGTYGSQESYPTRAELAAMRARVPAPRRY